MILFIDTSSPASAVVAAIDGDSAREFVSARLDRDLLRELAASGTVDRVAVASGPGSFTGLRVGVAFGLGLAMGLRIPIVPLPTLSLQAARSQTPVTAVVDAGRGRYYYQAPGSDKALGAPADIPTTHPLVGNLADRGPLLAGGHHFKPDGELLPFWQAATRLLETAGEVPYRNLEIEYMQSFAARKV